MKSKITKFAAAAVLIIAVIIGINQLGTPFDANQVYADVIDSIEQARTFSCRVIEEFTQDGQVEVFEELWMFKEPDLERHEWIGGVYQAGDIIITDFSRRQRLHLVGRNMTAGIEDISVESVVDADTGELRLTQLSTYHRDWLLKLSERKEVEDLGIVDLEGRSVRKLQSQGEHYLTTVWIDPESNLPVQVALESPRSRGIYTDIQIDVELDNDLFSLEPPAEYTLLTDEPYKHMPEYDEKLMAKIKYLTSLCIIFRDEHDQFPAEFTDLVTSGVVTDEVLQNILAAPDDPGGPPVILCHKLPELSADLDWPREIVVYEAPDMSPDNFIVAGFADMHVERLPNKLYLRQMLKSWPKHQKRISLQMMSLHWACTRFAQENEGRFPPKLADLSRLEDFLEERIRQLQAAPDGPIESLVIRYRQTHPDPDKKNEVVFYELFDQWPEMGAVVCFRDGNCEIITDQNQFEELIK